MVDGACAGGTWVAWGRDNREAPVRLAGRGAGPSGAEYHFEVKCVDGTASPYLATASLLAAGMIGVRAHTELKSHGLHVAVAEMSEMEREKRGVTQRMPLTLDEARAALHEDGVMRSVLGEELVKAYLAVNKVSTFLYLRDIDLNISFVLSDSRRETCCAYPRRGYG